MEIENQMETRYGSSSSKVNKAMQKEIKQMIMTKIHQILQILQILQNPQIQPVYQIHLVYLILQKN